MDGIHPEVVRRPAHEIDYNRLGRAAAMTVGFMTLTSLTMHLAKKLTAKEVRPFSGNMKANIAFSALSTIGCAASVIYSDPIRIPVVPPPPPPPVEGEEDIEEVNPPREEGRIVPANNGAIQPRDLQEMVDMSRQGIEEALRMGDINIIHQVFNIDGRHITIEIDLRNKGEIERLYRAQESLLQGQGQGQLLPPEKGEPVIEIIEEGPFLNGGIPLPNLPMQQVEGREDAQEDFVLVSQERIPEIGVSNEHLFGSYGALMRQMLFRSLLNEYIHLLQEKEINLQDDQGCPQLRKALRYLTDPSSAKDAKQQYDKYIEALEELVVVLKSQSVGAVCDAMVLARMTPRIHQFQEDYVKQHINPHDPMTLENFAEIFVERNKEIASCNPNMLVDWSTSNQIKLYGAWSWSHYMLDNPPQLRAQEGDIYYLRHATPNKYVNGEVIVDPIYRDFVRGADGLVLYAAHQRLNDDGVIENEDVRCQTLAALEEEEPNLLLLFQSVENNLFKKGARTFADLKTRLVDSFYQTEGSRLNRLPRCLQNDPNYRQKMEEICDFIHRTFFENRANVNQTKIDIYGGLKDEQKTTESQLFIMLFYYYQREELIGRQFDGKKIKYVNTGCKDNFDRGGGQNLAARLIKLIELYGKNIPPAELQALADSVQAPTLQLKGIPPIKYRIHPALCLANLLNGLSDASIQAIQARGRKGAIVIERRVEQHAVPVPKDAKTFEEYKAVLTSLYGRTYTKTEREMIRQKSDEVSIPYPFYVDGYEYDGTSGLFGRYSYTTDQIIQELKEEHHLSEAKAIQLVNQLDPHLFDVPFTALKGHLEGDQMATLRRVGSSHLSLDRTQADAFVAAGVQQFELVRGGQQVALLDINISLRFPKENGQQESGEWSWRINWVG
ncbi:MAG: hypothetical protein KDK76_02845 [Chlamydiia bacterium]|nr:hypothetical protein [Chlamydiia bacterium]